MLDFMPLPIKKIYSQMPLDFSSKGACWWHDWLIALRHEWLWRAFTNGKARTSTSLTASHYWLLDIGKYNIWMLVMRSRMPCYRRKFTLSGRWATKTRVVPIMCYHLWWALYGMKQVSIPYSRKLISWIACLTHCSLFSIVKERLSSSLLMSN